MTPYDITMEASPMRTDSSIGSNDLKSNIIKGKFPNIFKLLKDGKATITQKGNISDKKQAKEKLSHLFSAARSLKLK